VTRGSALLAFAATALVGCSSADDTAERAGPSGVTDLVAAGPAGGVVVEGDLFASPARKDTASSMELCDWVGEVIDVPDIPPQECMGERVPVRSHLDLFLLDLGWQTADGFNEGSMRVEVTADYDGTELVVTEVRRRGEPVEEQRPDITDFTVPRGDVGLCDRVPGSSFAPEPTGSADANGDRAAPPTIRWRFDPDTVVETEGEIVREGSWSCHANLVRMFGTGDIEAWVNEASGQLVLDEPNGARYVEMGQASATGR
jgi:hypothetical protein